MNFSKSSRNRSVYIKELRLPNDRADTTFSQPEAWTTTFEILQSESADPGAKLFAATTLKGKVWK